MSTLAASAEAEQPSDFDLYGPGVALCEPDAGLRTLLGEWLRRAAFDPLRRAEAASPTCVLLVVADVPAPRQNGAACIAALRRRFPGAKVLAISGQFMPGMQGSSAAATALGADAALAKPFSCGLFIDTVLGLVRS